MTHDAADDPRIDRRSYLAGGAAALGGLALGSGAVSADRKTALTGDEESVTEIDECTVIDEPGYYVLTADIDSGSQEPCIEIRASNVLLDGKGHEISGHETAVRVSATDDERLTTVTVTNLEIVADADENEAGSVVLDTVTRGLLSDLVIDVDETGIRFDDVVGSLVQGAEISGGLSGIGIHLEDSIRNCVVGTTVERLGVGVQLEDAHGNEFVDNTVYANFGIGVWLDDCHENEFSGNEIEGNDTELRLRRSNRNRFTSNEIRDGHSAGSLTASHENSFVGNDIVGHTTSFSGTESHRNTFTGNTVADTGTSDGMRWDASNENEFHGNVVRDNAGTGLYFGECYKNVLRANTVTANASGITFEDSDSNRIDQNDVEASYAGDGISLTDCSENVGRGNRAADNDGDSVSISGGANNEIEVNGVLRTEDNA